ncbi:hypothetical protein [Rhodococcus opacus]|uniref:hypothetical protein n=1 Tax=Rhodococcus opacus TaxID=37919 RepID=UPI0024B8A37E|nr:hypothetical protein [Rhodococcus opacus]MDJ0418563.1 hypothetical protein [Rhodococcus opacus]
MSQPVRLGRRYHLQVGSGSCSVDPTVISRSVDPTVISRFVDVIANISPHRSSSLTLLRR